MSVMESSVSGLPPIRPAENVTVRPWSTPACRAAVAVGVELEDRQTGRR